MGRDPSLGDMYPSIIINARRYHYGKSASGNGYLVENARYGKDYWHFEEEADLRAFLINLPESAEPRGPRLRAAHPDWDTTTNELRDLYLEEDYARQRELAEARVKAGTAPSYVMDLEGKHGPYEPQEIQRQADAEPPLARLERQLRHRKREFAGLNDAGKLRVLEGEIDWSGISNDDKRAVLAREIDFARITPRQFAFVYEDIAMDNEIPADATVATRLFEAIGDKQQPGAASSMSSDATDDFSEEKSRQKYWDERVRFKDEPFSVRVEGTQYILKADHDHLPGFKGHGGRDFYIGFDDGRLIHTANLWLNGEIPPEFRSQLPDNARFLDKVEFEQMLARVESLNVYQIWLNENSPVERVYQMFGIHSAEFPNGFRHVADVVASNVGEAYRKAHSEGNPLDPNDTSWKDWQNNEGVRVLVPDVRSADFGDVVVSPDDQPHQLVNGGFRSVPWTPLRGPHAEHATAEATAASDAPSPSAIAADNRPDTPTLSTGRTKGKKP